MLAEMKGFMFFKGMFNNFISNSNPNPKLVSKILSLVLGYV